jgi:nitrogen fixation/metabolism regulation signal transduction histidine kinase
MEGAYFGGTLLAIGVLFVMAAELWWFVNRTNRELARFLNAARSADFSQRFSMEDVGSGFSELGDVFTGIMNHIRDERADQAIELHRMSALIDHIPIPLLTLHGDDSVTLQNNAARRLFGVSKVTLLSDLKQFGNSFHDAVSEAVPGQRELVTFTVDGVEYQLTLAATENIVAGAKSRVISLQEIQSEINQTQTQAWHDLVTVLTHEIMNSITPVTSLASTAEEMVGDILKRTDDDAPINPELRDLHDAVQTVARRSDSLVQFVHSYRQLTRLAPPEKRRLQISDLFESARRLIEAERAGCGEFIHSAVNPALLDIYADVDLLEPVMLNLLRNALQATCDIKQPKIELLGRLNNRGNVVIEVKDNGPGVPAELVNKIFVPYFTTKKNGSGVGLALARQVMTAHEGFIRVAQNEAGGATFSMIF